MDILLDLIDRPIAFQRSFVRVTGCVLSALMLSQAVYWQRRATNGWWYKTQEEWQEETGLTRYNQEAARKLLGKLGILKEKRAGVPARLYFQVDVASLRKSLQSSMRPDHRLDGDAATDRPVVGQQTITETTQRLRRDSLPKAKKPSVAKPSSTPTDPRFTPFKAAFCEDFLGHTGVPAPWDVKESANLSRWLKKNPTITGEQWRAILANRSSSHGVNRAAELSTWLGRALSWLNGQANEFGQGVTNGSRFPAAPDKAIENATSAARVIAGIRARGDRQGAHVDGGVPGGAGARVLPGNLQPALVPRIPPRSDRSLSPPRRAASA